MSCDFLEKPDQKNLVSSEKEKVTELNKKNAEKTNSSEVQRSYVICHQERQDKVDFVPRNSMELRENADGKDGACTASLERQESNLPGDNQDTEDKSGCLLFKGGKRGLPPKEDSRGTEAENAVSTAASETVLDKRSTGNQRVDGMNGGPSSERYCPSITRPQLGSLTGLCAVVFDATLKEK